MLFRTHKKCLTCPYKPFSHFSVDPQHVVHLSCGTWNMAIGIHLFMRQVSLID